MPKQQQIPLQMNFLQAILMANLKNNKKLMSNKRNNQKNNKKWRKNQKKKLLISQAHFHQTITGNFKSSINQKLPNL